MRPTNTCAAGCCAASSSSRQLGVNPFKFGFVGSTDVHNSLTAIEEDNFFGKHVNQEPSPMRWEHVSKQGFGKTRYTWHYTAAGYAAVWATENTREALWDALKRREAYGTSGSRMVVRFFGGWDFAAATRGRASSPRPATRRACRWGVTCLHRRPGRGPRRPHSSSPR